MTLTNLSKFPAPYFVGCGGSVNFGERMIMPVDLSPMLPRISPAVVSTGLEPSLPRPGFVNSIGMKMVIIPAGKFLMGVPEEEPYRDEDKPQHEVTITKDFHVGVHQVTHAQYENVMGTNPSHFIGVDLPVEKVSWYDAVEFCNHLSEKDGNEYRLPTDAEWEYACRAGTTTITAFGDLLSADQANFGGGFSINTPGKKCLWKTTPVGSYSPNAWGLYDMHGNVMEWCLDYHSGYKNEFAVDPRGPEHGTHRVVRGGSWAHFRRDCSSGYRFGKTPDFRNPTVGFRVVSFADSIGKY